MEKRLNKNTEKLNNIELTIDFIYVHQTNNTLPF